MFPHRIYMSGGGICGMAHIGALLELRKHISFSMIKEWMGVSAGSLLAMCLTIGYTLEELEDFCIRFDFTNIKEMDSVPGWILRMGIDTGDRLERLIHACLHVKGLSSELTFQESRAICGYTLRIVVTDLNNAAPIMFSPEDTPTYRIADAVRASMTVPIYFQPFMCPVTGHYYMDGAVVSNYPLFLLPVEEHKKTISLLIRNSVRKIEDNDLSMEQILTRPIYILYSEKMNTEIQIYDSPCIQMELGETDMFDFSMEQEVKQEIVEKGKQSVIDYMKARPIPLRRHSLS